MGTVESAQNWRWAAFGKHPVARDFFRIGPDLPLGKGFSDWVENGYQILTSKKEAFHGHCSWRFWARGSQKEGLACGLVRDSSDSLGRPYPLLMMGTGFLNGWEDHWDLLPFACERSWDQIEYFSSQRFDDFKKLEDEIQNIRPPLPQWPELTTRREKLKDFDSTFDPKEGSLNLENFKRRASILSEKAEVLIHLDQNPFHDQFTMISFWHLLFKSELKIIPSALFMGGTLESAFLAVFRRPLVATDFVQLWSVSTHWVKENGSRTAG